MYVWFPVTYSKKMTGVLVSEKCFLQFCFWEVLKQMVCEMLHATRYFFFLDTVMNNKYLLFETHKQMENIVDFVLVFFSSYI